MSYEREKNWNIYCETTKKMGYTQDYLGKLLGVSGKVVSKWETGACLPDILLLNDLSELLGVTTTELLDSENNEDMIVNQ